MIIKDLLEMMRPIMPKRYLEARQRRVGELGTEARMITIYMGEVKKEKAILGGN